MVIIIQIYIELILILNKPDSDLNQRFEEHSLFKLLQSKNYIIPTQKDKNDCFSDIGPKMRIGLSCQSKSIKAYKNKYPYLNEEPFESSSNPSYYKTKEMFHKENISFKLPFSEQDSSQEEEIDEYLYENSYADIKHRSSFSKEDFEIRKRSYTDYSFSEIKISSSEIKTSSYYLKSISDNESIRWSSLDSKSKNLSEFIKKEEHKT